MSLRLLTYECAGSALLCLASVGRVLHQRVQRRRDEHGRIEAREQAEDDRQCEFSDRCRAEDREDDDRKQRGDRRVDAASHRLFERTIADLEVVESGVGLEFELRLVVLSDAVEDDDRVVDRVGDDRDHSRDERAVDLNAEHDREREHDRDVMAERDDRGDAAPRLKPDDDIDEDERERDDEREDRGLDYLGSLLGLGIKREKTGDIIVRDDGADIVICEELAEFISLNYDKAGRTSLSVEILPIGDLKVAEKSFSEREDTVASLRLDNIISSAFGISRSKAAEAIKKGIVFVNNTECLKIDKDVFEGDKLVLRGRGKAYLTEIGGTSRKGRVYVKFRVY